MGAAYSSLGRTKVLCATSLVLLDAKAKFLLRKPSGLRLLWKKFLKWVDPKFHIIRDGHAKVFC